MMNHMSQTGTSMKQEKPDGGVASVIMNLEVDVIPVSDVERSKQFYQRLGWRFDEDVAPAALLPATRQATGSRWLRWGAGRRIRARCGSHAPETALWS